jgi:hypothetical protein
VGIYLIIPALLIAAMNYFAVEVPVDESEKKTDDAFNEIFGEEGEDTQPPKVAPPPLVLSFWAYLVILVIYTRWQRKSTREKILKKLYEERAAARGADVDSNQLRLFLERNRADTSHAHQCCCFYANDDVFFEESGGQQFVDGQVDEVEGDFCTKLWQCLANTFWASCCGCWCQCCSICAVFQEEMEVNRLTGNEGHTMDYCTFQVSLQG